MSFGLRGGKAALLLFAAAAAASATSLALAASAPTAVVHVDQPGPQIDRHIYGQFAEHLGRGIYEGVWVGESSPIPNTHGFRNDVIAALRELHVPDVRWPGGCFADEYHWRDGIGPRASRPVTLNTNWGGVPDDNAFGTHEFMEFAELIGADAYINGNLGTGSSREMAEWLQYMTSDKPTALTAERARNGHPGPWKVAYFAVGNEAWGCGGNMRADFYVDQFRQVATFLKAPQGARPIIVASGGHDDDTSWTQTLIEKAKHDGQFDMGAITFHSYTLPTDQWKTKGPATGFGEDQWISTLAHTLRMDDFVTHNSAILDQYDPETGTNPGFLYQLNTLRDAVVAALNFNIFHRHADRVRMANIAQMVNVLQAMILTKGPRMILTPTYYAFKMFRSFQDATYLPVDVQAPAYTLGSTSVPGVSVSAARTSDGKIVVALVNLNPNTPTPLSIALAGAHPKQVHGDVLTASSMDARNSFETPDAIHPVEFHGATVKGGAISLTLPAKSVVVLTLN